MSPNIFENYYYRAKIYCREIFQEITERDWRQPPRTWAEFFEQFSVPRRHPHHVSARIGTNLRYYQANYLLIYVAFIIVYAVRHPWSVFIFGAIATGWVYVTSPKPLVFQGQRITRKQRFTIMLSVTLILLLISKILFTFPRTLMWPTLAIFIHALLRHANIRKMEEQRKPLTDDW